jgi:hypothetical protein
MGWWAKAGHVLAVAALALWVAVAPSQGRAATIPGSEFTVGNWQGWAYTDSNGAFSHCAIITDYKSGISLVFALSARTWSMGLSDSAWSLQVGQQYPVTYSIDGEGSYSATAVAIDSNTVEIELENSVNMFNRFRWGNVLNIYTVSQNLTFYLTGTSAGLVALGQCYSARGTIASSNPFAVANTQSNPFAPQSLSSGSGQPGYAEADRAEAATLAANLLGTVGTTNFHILTEDETPKESKGYSTVWLAEKIVGVINIDRPTAGITEDNIAGSIISGDEANCKGKFASGAMPDDTGSNTNLKQLFTSCQENEAAATTVYYLIFPRPKGGYYIIGTFTTSDPGNAERAESGLSVRPRTLGVA